MELGMRLELEGKTGWELKEKWKKHSKPLNTNGLATKIILSFIREDKLRIMIHIYYSLSFMLREFEIYEYPASKLNNIAGELDKIQLLGKEDKVEILDFIVKKLKKAHILQAKVSNHYRMSKKLSRDNFDYRYRFPERFLSELKNRDNFSLYCLLYFFDYALPDVITSEDLSERIQKIEQDEAVEFDEYEKSPYVKSKNDIVTRVFNATKGISENKKWIVVSHFLYEQFGFVKDKEELIKSLKRYGRFIKPVYEYIYQNYPHDAFLFLKLPKYSGMYVFDEKGNYLGTRFIFFD